MNIVLCGMMGAGKTSVGIRLSQMTGRRWYDTDDLITQKYGKISNIFEFYGEERFRQMETEIVHHMAQEEDSIISTGGGCVLRMENCIAFKERGKIVFLEADLDELFRRAGHTGDERPLLKNTTKEKMQNLLEQRAPIYRACADYTVNTNGKSVDEVAEEILGLFGIRREN